MIVVGCSSGGDVPPDAVPRTQIAPDIDVLVGPNGAFFPPHVVVRSGQAVRWILTRPGDGIVPSYGTGSAWPDLCSQIKAYGTTPNNEFGGPIVKGQSGVFSLAPFEYGSEEFPTLPNGACEDGTPGMPLDLAAPTVGPFLCTQTGDPEWYGKSREATWQSDDLKGVFIRLNWSDLQPSKTGPYKFAALDREVEQAVRYSKLYSLTIKAGAEGTPPWIFATEPPDPTTPTVPGRPITDPTVTGGVPRVIVDVNEEGDSCGWKSLGNPGNKSYQRLYNDMLTAVATHLKTNAEWYRRLAYIKPSGANASSAEWRLPNGCKSVAVGPDCGGVPSCNNHIWHAAGYTQAGLEAFHSAQLAVIARQFPGKTMSYQLIHAGFPRANAAGGPDCWMDSAHNFVCAAGFLPGDTPTSQTESLLAHGRATYILDFAVQHNGLGGEPAVCPGVPFSPGTDGCPNWWAWDAGNRPLSPGASGQITGYQTSNPKQVTTGDQLQDIFENLYNNSDGVFLEIYEEVLWRASNTNGGVLRNGVAPAGRTIRQWSNELDVRRRAGWPTATTLLPSPTPITHRFVFTRNASPQIQTYTYVHSNKCAESQANYGSVTVIP